MNVVQEVSPTNETSIQKLGWDLVSESDSSGFAAFRALMDFSLIAPAKMDRLRSAVQQDRGEMSVKALHHMSLSDVSRGSFPIEPTSDSSLHITDSSSRSRHLASGNKSRPLHEDLRKKDLSFRHDASGASEGFVKPLEPRAADPSAGCTSPTRRCVADAYSLSGGMSSQQGSTAGSDRGRLCGLRSAAT